MRQYLPTVMLILVCLAFCPNAEAQDGAKQPLTPAQSLNLRSISDLRFSPDSEQIAFVVTEPVKGPARARHIWLLNFRTREMHQFTNSPKNEDTPRWSPDGKQLAFLSNRDEGRQIYVISLEGGEGRRLIQSKHEIESFAWSPDGSQIMFIAADPKTEAEEKKEKDKDDARVVDKDDRLARLWILDVKSGKIRQLTSGHWRMDAAEWMPDGKNLAVSATDRPDSEEETSRIFSVNAADGKLIELNAPRGPYGRFRISPDGKTIAYVGSRVDGPVPHDLFVSAVSGGAGRNISAKSLDRPIGAYAWSGNNSVLTIIQHGFKTNLLTISTDGTVTKAGTLPFNPRSFDLAASGRLAFVGSNATEPEEIWLQEPGKLAQRLSQFNMSWSEFKLAQPEMIRYKSFDGLEIEGAILRPAATATKLPLVVLVHGGPTGAWSDSIESWGQLLVAHSFAVFYPNVRGSTGYGQRFIEMNRNDWGGGDFKDVMAGVDYLIAQNIADPNRLGIGGWSYGGYMSEWAITQTNRFKAAVCGAGLSNLASEFGTENGSSYDRWFFGTPYENLDGFMKSSPLKYLKSIRTPTLILQGEADVTDPIGQSQELYRGLKYYHVDSDFVLYPREGHGLREEKHLIDRLNRIVAWYEKYLKRS